MAIRTRTAASKKETFIVVPSMKMDRRVDVSIAPDMINKRVILLPCFITTDIISPLKACKEKGNIIKPFPTYNKSTGDNFESI